MSLGGKGKSGVLHRLVTTHGVIPAQAGISVSFEVGARGIPACATGYSAGVGTAAPRRDPVVPGRWAQAGRSNRNLPQPMRCTSQ